MDRPRLPQGRYRIVLLATAVVLVYGIGGPVLDDALQDRFQAADSPGQCTTVPADYDYTCCGPQEIAINTAYTGIHRTLTLPQAILNGLTGSSIQCFCRQLPQNATLTIQEGQCYRNITAMDPQQ